jgi:hypothetical protein
MKGCAVDIQHRFLILKECVIETRYWVVEICIFFFCDASSCFRKGLDMHEIVLDGRASSWG